MNSLVNDIADDSQFVTIARTSMRQYCLRDKLDEHERKVQPECVYLVILWPYLVNTQKEILKNIRKNFYSLCAESGCPVFNENITRFWMHFSGERVHDP